MHLTNKTSTITVAVVAALVALAIVAHASGALTLSPSHTATQGSAAAARGGLAGASGTIGDPGVPCLQGYVWRQVVPDDYVCVTPGVRAQAAYDNSQANNRVALLSLWMSDGTPPSQPPRQNCSGGVCTTTEGGRDGPNFQINGDHFNSVPIDSDCASF